MLADLPAQASTPLWRLEFAVVDVESTGLPDAEGLHRVLEIAIAHTNLSEALSVPVNTLLAIDRGVGPVDIHGVLKSRLETAPGFDEVEPSIRNAFAGRVAVAHNAHFELRLLSREFEGVSDAPTSVPWLCTQRLARKLGLPASLEALSHELLGPTGLQHAAATDAVRTARILPFLLRRCMGRGVNSLGDLVAMDVFVARSDHEGVQEPRVAEHTILLEKEKVQTYLSALGGLFSKPAAEWRTQRAGLLRLQKRLRLSTEAIRYAHAMTLAAQLNMLICRITCDPFAFGRVDDVAAELRSLGWAPGLGDASGRLDRASRRAEENPSGARPKPHRHKHAKAMKARLIELVRRGATPRELANDFPVTASQISAWVRAAK